MVGGRLRTVRQSPTRRTRLKRRKVSSFATVASSLKMDYDSAFEAASEARDALLAIEGGRDISL